MPVTWRPSTPDAHDALPPTRRPTPPDPAWAAILAELAQDRSVVIEYDSSRQRGALARSLRRRAALQGFRVDIRQGDGHLSVRQATEEA
jgi:hypothetical protein